MASILEDPIQNPSDLRKQNIKIESRRRTFWDCCAIIRTKAKSYIPSAVLNSWSASTRKMIYFTASSTVSGSDSKPLIRIFLCVNFIIGTHLEGYVKPSERSPRPVASWQHAQSISIGCTVQVLFARVLAVVCRKSCQFRLALVWIVYIPRNKQQKGLHKW